MVNQLQQLQQGLIPQPAGAPAIPLNINPRRIEQVLLNDDVLQRHLANAAPGGGAAAQNGAAQNGGNNDENGLNILPAAQENNDDQNMDEDMH